MLLVTVLLVAASCSAAKLSSNERVTFIASSPRNDFIPINMPDLHDLDGESKRLPRKQLSSQQESSKTSNRYGPTSNGQVILDLYDPPSNYRRRHRNHHSKKQDKQKSKRYITSDQIRPKRNQHPSVSKDISNEFIPSPVDSQVTQEYYPLASIHNVNQYASDNSIHFSNTEKPKSDRISTDFSHPKIDQYSANPFLQQLVQHDQSYNTNSNPTPEVSFSQNIYLPLSEVKQAPMQYVPPGNANKYFLPANQIDPTSNQYLQNNPQPNEKDYSIINPINVVDATRSIQLAEPNIKEVSIGDMAAEGQNQFPLIPPSESQHLSKDFLSPSYKHEDKDTMKNFNTQEITENFNQYQNIAPSPISYSTPSEIKTVPIPYTPQENQPTYLPSHTISQEYLPVQDFSDQSISDPNENSKADRRNDFSYRQQISNPLNHPDTLMYSQKTSNFTTLRPIKQFNPQFSQTPYQNNPPTPIERSGHDNTLKTEAIMTNFPTQGQGFDPAKYATNQYPQSMPFGSKLPQQNSHYASPRSSNLPITGLQSNSDKQYETTTVNLNNKYELANGIDNLRQPGDLIIPNPYEPYQQQHQHPYAKNYGHQSYPADSSTEAVPILKQTNEIAYDGSFHYETLTGDQTHVIQEGHIENPGTDDEEQVIHGSYSFVGGDGITYTVNYVADSNGFRAAGDHLPTPPPVPDVIQRSIEVNLAAEANKAAQEYQSQSQPGKKGAEEVTKVSHGYLDQTSRNFDLETKRPIQNYRNPFSDSFNNHRYENPSSVNRNQYQNHVGYNGIHNRGYQNPPIDKSNSNQFLQSTQNEKKTNIQYANPQSNNAQAYPSTQINTNNNALGYPNTQTSNNNNISGYKNPQTTYGHNLQEYQIAQTSNINNNQDYKNPESSYIQGFQNYQTSNDNNIQNYKNPRMDDKDSSLGYQNSPIENNNNQGYQNPQTSYNNNIQNYQTQQNGYNNNIQGYQGSQTSKNDLGYSNPQVVDNSQYQSFPTNTQPAEIVQNYQSSETMTESSQLPKETGYL